MGRAARRRIRVRKVSLDIIGSQGPDRWYLGENVLEGGLPLFIDLKDGHPNWMVAGPPGMGKGRVARTAIAHHARAGSQISVVASQPAEYLPFFKAGVLTVASSAAEIDNLLNKATAEMERRIAEVTAFRWGDGTGVETYLDLPGTGRYRWVLIFDEIGNTLGVFGLSKCDKGQIVKWTNQLGRLVMEGRKSGVNVIALPQRATLPGISMAQPENSLLHAGLAGRLAMGNESGNIESMFDRPQQPQGQALAALGEARGRGVVIGADFENMARPWIVQVLDLSQEQCLAVCADYVGPPQLDLGSNPFEGPSLHLVDDLEDDMFGEPEPPAIKTNRRKEKTA